ncbi:hypothetical protein BHE74_00003772 [Ensete ventricosum]|nr:hypothetical protein BHE74_00003772 [Ensete ventricosum]
MEAQTIPTGQAQKFSTIILALEGGPISQERPSDNSNAEHRTEPNYPPQVEEVTTSGPTPNRFWRMMIDPGFSLSVSNPAPFVITAEAFLGLTNQVQALAGMVQTIVPYLPQLIQSVTIQSALLATPPLDGVTCGLESRGSTRGRGTTTPNRESSRGFPACTCSVTKPLSRSGLS